MRGAGDLILARLPRERRLEHSGVMRHAPQTLFITLKEEQAIHARHGMNAFCEGGACPRELALTISPPRFSAMGVSA
jgi:hypothetical protein